jgi:hypothetical protein
MASAIKKEIISSIKNKLLRPSLTSHYLCNFSPPSNLTEKNPGNGFFLGRGINVLDKNKMYDRLSLGCCEASLPGSSLATLDINNDYHGVTQKHAYRRLYDDRADFTFYVDGSEYYVIHFFEAWISYCINEQRSDDRIKRHQDYTYRVNFPDTYYANEMSIVKFERDYIDSSRSSTIQYNFVGAFPISISSMPVSYDQSNLLKCTVSFSYQRYYLDKFINSQSYTPKNPNATGVSELNNKPASKSSNGTQVASSVSQSGSEQLPQRQIANQNILNNRAFVRTSIYTDGGIVR